MLLDTSTYGKACLGKISIDGLRRRPGAGIALGQ